MFHVDTVHQFSSTSWQKELKFASFLKYILADRKKKNIINGRENEIITEQLCMLVLLRYTMS